jgi:hypothetical protein
MSLCKFKLFRPYLQEINTTKNTLFHNNLSLQHRHRLLTKKYFLTSIKFILLHTDSNLFTTRNTRQETLLFKYTWVHFAWKKTVAIVRGQEPEYLTLGPSLKKSHEMAEAIETMLWRMYVSISLHKAGKKLFYGVAYNVLPTTNWNLSDSMCRVSHLTD